MNWKFEIRNWKLTRQGFTIVELLVAMGLLVILVGLSSVVFSTTVKSHRTAMATIEITRKLNAITGQLNMDFQGLRKDAPLVLLFERDTLTGFRFDQILFFADGDFQSMNQYDTNSDGVTDSIISSNLSRVYYGLSNSSSASGDYRDFATLARRAHLLTSDLGLINSLISNGEAVFPLIYDTSSDLDYSEFLNSDMVNLNDSREFDTITLADWVNVVNYYDTTQNDYSNAIYALDSVFSNPGRPVVDFSATGANTYRLLMAQGVLDLNIQFAYFNDSVQEFHWFPDVDPDNDVGTNDNHFGNNVMNIPVVANTQSMGIIFNIPRDISQPAAATLDEWYIFGNDPTYQYCQYRDNVAGALRTFPDDFFPAALKFTFRLKDSNDIFPDGKTFTHIVYLDN